MLELQEIKSGTQRDDYESWVNWAFFKRTDGGLATKEDLKEEVKEETGFAYYYNGPGRGFGNGPSIKINKHHVLITQICGMDI